MNIDEAKVLETIEPRSVKKQTPINRYPGDSDLPDDAGMDSVRFFHNFVIFMFVIASKRLITLLGTERERFQHGEAENSS